MTLKSCMLIGSDKGGVGKSLISQLVIQAHDLVQTKVQHAIPRLKVIEIDNQKRLTTQFGAERIDLSLSASYAIENALANRWNYESCFNPAYSIWQTGHSLTDLGANSTSMLLDWAQHNSVGEFAKQDEVLIRFVAVTTPDDLALSSARQALIGANNTLGADLYLVLNDATGGDAGYLAYEGTAVLNDLFAEVDKLGVKVIRIPYCECQLFPYAKAMGYTLIDLLQNRDRVIDEICRKHGIPETTKRFQMARFGKWIQAVQQELAPLFDQPAQRRAA